MTHDLDLSRTLTAALRSVPGVTGVYAARPVVGVAVAVAEAVSAVAPTLELRAPDVLVDIDRADEFTTVSAHISTSTTESSPAVLRAAGETLRDLIRVELPEGAEFGVNVKVRFVEDPLQSPG